MKTAQRPKALLSMGAAFIISSVSLTAGDSKMAMETPVAPDPWNYCDIFDLGKLYKSDTGFINKVSLIGRYHGQYHWSDSNQSDTSEDWENRRVRAGVQIGFLNDFEFEGQFNLDVNGDGRFFDSVEDLFIVWEPNDDLYAIVGKVKPKISREYSTSSKRIKTVERSQFVNQVVPDKIGGGIVGYTKDKLFLEAGLFAGSNSEDWDLPYDGDSKLSAIGRIGYDVTEATNVRFDYFYADGAGKDRSVEDYDNIFSLNSQSDWDRLHLVTDLIYATGADEPNDSDGFSVVVMPYYDITDKLEAVFRYTYSGADGDSGIRLQSRYERESALDTRGDNYNAFYGGLNYYLCEDKLKLMTGVEYSTMDQSNGDDYKNWTIFSGVRLYF